MTEINERMSIADQLAELDENWLADIIMDSLGPGWTPRDAAKHILLNMPALTSAARVIRAQTEALEALSKYEGHMVFCGHGKDMERPCVCGLNDAHDKARAAIKLAQESADAE